MNDLTIMSAVEQQKLQEMMGLSQGQSDRVPMLKFNTDTENESGQELQAGTFYLKDQDTLAYSKNVKIRVLGHHYQYIEYSPEQKKTVNKTVINKNFGQEFLDEKGTIKCGMTKPKSQMEPYEKERFKNVTCFRQIRGLVTYTGFTAGSSETRQEVVVEDQPMIMLLKGSNFMPFDEEVMKKMPRGAAPWDYWLNCSLERRKNGSVVYYVMHYDFDASSPVQFDSKTADTVRHFASQVEAENNRIRKSHDDSIANRSALNEDYDIEEGSLEADFG